MKQEPFDIDTNNKEFQDAYRLIQYTSDSVFLTGRAGTGKSTFLKYICQNTPKKYVVVAPTGIAAINAGGVTIHSFFKAPFRPIPPDDADLSTKDGRIYDFLKYRKAHIKLIKELELVIIDEVSMVRSDLLDFIDRVLRVYSGKLNLPFGGKQLLMVGDVFQLEPVVKRDDWQILKRFYKSAYFFSARVFQQIPLIQIELRKVYRQNDTRFVEMLDRIRIRNVYEQDMNSINARCHPGFQVPLDELFITLATRRNTVDYINDNKLSELEGDEVAFNGIVSGEFPNSALPTSMELVLKENAQVMFVKNDMERRWYNGSLGRIEEINEDGVYVRLENENIHFVEKEVWRNLRFNYDEKNKKIIEEEIGSFTQYPLKLAWAITVHKSQGLTFDRVVLDFSGGAFAGGQLYVALSRCRSLEGIILTTKVTTRDIIVNPAVISFSKSANNKALIEHSIKSAEADDLYKDALSAFNKKDYPTMIDSLASAIEKRNDFTKASVRRYAKMKFTLFTKMNKKIKSLERQLKKQKENSKEFAHEYFLMANECVVKADDRRAAINNLNKALKLNPEYFDALMKRAHFQADLKNYIEADEDYSQAIKLKKRSYKAFYNRGRTRMLLKNYNGAYNDLKKAVRIKSDKAEAYYFLGDVCEKMGEMEEANHFWNIADNLGYQE